MTETENKKKIAWKSIAFVLLAASYIVYQDWITNKNVDATVKTELITFLKMDYAKKAMPDFQVSADTELFKQVEITSCESKGNKKNVIIKTEFLVDGNLPPDGKSVRYFLFNRSAITGWALKKEVSSIKYYFPIF